MSTLKNRGKNLSAKNAAFSKPLSTSKFKDDHSGLTYNYEDRLSKMKLFKTTLLMILLSLLVFYFLYNFYILLTNYFFDFYWYNYRGVRDHSNSKFLQQIWVSNLFDMLILIFKMTASFYLFKYINSKLLLTYDDTSELNHYN
jgi:hypothetical protein